MLDGEKLPFSLPFLPFLYVRQLKIFEIFFNFRDLSKKLGYSLRGSLKETAYTDLQE